MTYFKHVHSKFYKASAGDSYLFFRSVLCYSVQGGSNMTGTDLCVNKPHCAAAV